MLVNVLLFCQSVYMDANSDTKIKLGQPLATGFFKILFKWIVYLSFVRCQCWRESNETIEQKNTSAMYSNNKISLFQLFSIPLSEIELRAEELPFSHRQWFSRYNHTFYLILCAYCYCSL